jgi:putative ABC transport system permease protein
MSIAQDVLYSLRLLRREPGPALTAAATMALGIGAATALFSVMYGVLLKPLPWPEPDRLVRLEERRGGHAGRIPWTITNGTYLAWQDQRATIEEIGGWMSVLSTFRGAGDPERLRISRVTPSVFRVIRARPASGRLFVEEDAATRNVNRVILSHRFHQQRFDGADVIGRAIQLDDVAFTVVGVMPADFAFPDRETEAWIPAYIGPVSVDGGKTISVSIFSALARMRPGVTPEQVAAEATSRAAAAPDLSRAGLALFGGGGPVTITALPALDVMIREVRPALRVLFAAVLLLLATAIASVATVLLARATKRRRETTLRAALGAAPWRLVRQWLIESAMIGTLGGVVGLLGAGLLLRGLPSLLPADFPRMADVAMDWRVATFAVAATLLSTIVCGLVPSAETRRLDLVRSLSEDSLAPIGGGARTAVARTRAMLMVAQVAVASLLLIGAGLLGRSLFALIHVDRGYDSANLLTARLNLPQRTTFAQSGAALQRIEERLRHLPGVAQAAFGNGLPLVTAGSLSGFTIPSPRGPGSRIQVQSLHRTVSPSYFAAMKLRLIAGRLLTDADTASSQSVLVVNRSFAAQYLGDKPIGQRLPYGLYDRNNWEIVGVVDDMQQGGLDVAGFTSAPVTAQPEMFSSYRQLGAMFSSTIMLLIRTAGDPSALAPTVRRIVSDESSTLVVDSVMTMEDRLMSSLARPRAYAYILGGFAIFALAIAGVGLFGVLSYTVAQRTREIGVRTALGAQTSDVVALILKQGMLIAAAGLAIGLATAGLAARWLSTVLYGVSPYDPATFLAVPIALVLVAAVACAAPAWRAARIDSLRALRSG